MGTKNRLPVTAVEKSRIRSVLPGGLPMNILVNICSMTSGVRGVTDVISTELAAPDPAEGHIEAHDLALLAVFVDDRVEGHVRIGRFDVVGHLDVVELRAPDGALLFLDGQGVPASRSWTYFWTMT